MEAAVQNPAPAAVVETQVNIPAAHTPEYAEWRNTGKIPQPKPAEAAPANESEPKPTGEAKTEAEADAAPEHKGKKTAKERAAEIEAEVADLQAKLAKRAELRKQLAEDDKPTKKADAEPAKASDTDEYGLKVPKKPKEADYDTWEKFEEAKDKYADENAEYKAERAVLKDRNERAKQESDKALSDRLNEGRKRYGAQEFEAKMKPVVQQLMADEISPVIKSLVMDSEIMADLLYVLGKDAVDLDAFVELAKSNPSKAVRKLVLIEDLTQKELQKAAKPAAPEKKISDAPPPPKELNARGGAPPDEVDQAVKANDFRSFREAGNRRDMERRKGN